MTLTGNRLENILTHQFIWHLWKHTEIIIDEIDVSGGTGSNFIFEWKIPKNCPEPLFEGIMTFYNGTTRFIFHQLKQNESNKMAEILTTIFFVFAVIDPIGSIPVYLEATKEFDLIHKRKIALGHPSSFSNTSFLYRNRTDYFGGYVCFT